MKETILILTALTLHLTSAIRVFSGTGLGLLTQSSASELEAQRRSWPVAAEPGLYKVKLTQRGYIQFLRYMVNIPPLQQYTFCLWVNSANFTYDHPLFSYSRDEKESMVKVWLSPKEKSLKISVKEQPILKVPLQLRENRWHHFCQSWSGVTGEWLVFVDGVLKASEKFPSQVGVMLPGGGDIAVGQELTDFNKGLDDGIEGEIFGFNMVDEAVDLQELGKQKQPSNYRSDVDEKQPTAIPEFKKMPTSRKSFEEIKGYISKLPPTHPAPTGKPERIRVGELPASSQSRAPTRAPTKAPGFREGRKHESQRRPQPTSSTRERVQPRPVPLKVVQPSRAPSQPRPKTNQVYNENYNIHTYKGPNARPTGASYKTFEPQEEEENVIERRIGVVGPTEGAKRKRQNFDVTSAWEANRVHPFYHPKLYDDLHRRQFHFESTQLQVASRRNLIVEPYDDKVDHVKLKTRVSSSLPASIPVSEVIDEGYRRRRRRDIKRKSSRGARQLPGEFKPLPALPEEFEELLNPTTKSSAVLADLSAYIASKVNTSATDRADFKTLHRRKPQAFPSLDEALVAEQNFHIPDVSQTLLENRVAISSKTGSAGSELVRLSFTQCANSRGSPMTDSRHVLISWADTPVRMYGGAIVANAVAQCGQF